MRLRSHTGIVLAPLVLVGSLAYLGEGIHVGSGGGDTPPFHVDEAHKLGETFYYHLFFEQRDLNHPAWTEDFYARTNPPAAKYLFGAVLAAAGRPVRDQQLQNDFEQHWEEPEELRRYVPDSMLRITRGISVVFGALLCMLLFIIGQRVGGLAAGLITAVLLLGNPHFEQCAQRGLTDTILMFHLTLIVPASLWSAGVLRRYWQGKAAGGAVRRWWIVFLATVFVPGLVIALAAGSKLNGGLTGPVYAISMLLTALLCSGATPLWRRLGLAFAVTCLAGVVAVAVFVAMNPCFHHDPIARVGGTLDVYRDWMIKQQIIPGGGLFTLHQKTTAAGYYSLRDPSLPLPRLLGGLHLEALGSWLASLGFAVGLVHLAGRCLPGRQAASEAGRAGSGGARIRVDAAVVLAWVIVCVAGITLWLPTSWDRYLLPPYLAVCLTTAIGLAALPGATGSIFRLFGGKSARRVRLRIAAGSAAAAALWCVLAFTSWVIAPILLRDPAAWTDPDAVDAHSSSPTFRHHLGLLFLQWGMNRRAAEQFETALSLLDRDLQDRPSAAVQRCCLLYDLARARAATGNRAGGAEALRQHIAALEKLRDGMTSTDPYVRGAYDLNVAERREALAGMLQGRSGEPGRNEGQGRFRSQSLVPWPG